MKYYACSRTELENGPVSVTVTDKSGRSHLIGIFLTEAGTIHALSDRCSHGDVLLSEGDVENGCVECWGHGALFNLETGEATLPATEPATVYPLEIEDDKVFVQIG